MGGTKNTPDMPTEERLRQERAWALEAFDKASGERDDARAESAGRLRELERVAVEKNSEWKRAENAEAERDRLRALVGRMMEALRRVPCASWAASATSGFYDDKVMGTWRFTVSDVRTLQIALADPTGQAAYEEWKAMAAVVEAARNLYGEDTRTFVALSNALAALDKVRAKGGR